MNKIDSLKKITLFEGLNDTQLEVVANLMTETDVSTGQFLVYEGDPGNELYIVKSGMIEVVKSEHGRFNVVSIIGQGGFIGEVAILAKVPRTAGIRAKTDASCFVISGKDFEELLEKYPKISVAIIHRLAIRLLSMTQH